MITVLSPHCRCAVTNPHLVSRLNNTPFLPTFSFAILSGGLWEPPYISRPYHTPQGSHNKTKSRRKLWPFIQLPEWSDTFRIPGTLKNRFTFKYSHCKLTGWYKQWCKIHRGAANIWQFKWWPIPPKLPPPPSVSFGNQINTNVAHRKWSYFWPGLQSQCNISRSTRKYYVHVLNAAYDIILTRAVCISPLNKRHLYFSPTFLWK
jgi:hypothetical protein